MEADEPLWSPKGAAKRRIIIREHHFESFSIFVHNPISLLAVILYPDFTTKHAHQGCHLSDSTCISAHDVLTGSLEAWQWNTAVFPPALYSLFGFQPEKSELFCVTIWQRTVTQHIEK